MQKKTTYAIMTLAVLLSGCTGENYDIPDGKAHEIAFTSETTDPETVRSKADTDIIDGGWGVFAYYTGKDAYTTPAAAEGIIFNNRKVFNNAGIWDYTLSPTERKEYWPTDPSEKVTFFAYAPYGQYGPYGTASSPTLTVGAEGPSIRYTAPADHTEFSLSKDLVWGVNTSGLPHRNVSRTTLATEDVVDMHFRHAPAKLHFTINGATVLNNDTTTDLGTATLSDNTTYGTPTRSNNYYYRQVTNTTVTEHKVMTETGTRLFVESVQFKNFLREGTLFLNNTDPYTPRWTASSDEANLLTYDIAASLTDNPINESISYNESRFGEGWGTVYTGIDANAEELFSTADRTIYIIPKTADHLETGSKNITVTVKYHVIAITTITTTTTTTVQTHWQRSRNENTGYADYTGGTYQNTTNTSTDTAVDTQVNYSNDNEGPDGIGQGWHAKGTITTDILGGRDYTINLFLNGRDITLSVIPQPWTLDETTYDYNENLNPIIQPLTYDPRYVDKVEGSNVYINNRTGRFTFLLGTGKYVYWQASLVGDDAFAFTDSEGRYLRDTDGNLRTAVRGAIGDSLNELYIKAKNTSSGVTSRAKLRIYLFDSANHATVAIPKSDWKFIDEGYEVLEWQIVQNAN